MYHKCSISNEVAACKKIAFPAKGSYVWAVNSSCFRFNVFQMLLLKLPIWSNAQQGRRIKRVLIFKVELSAYVIITLFRGDYSLQIRINFIYESVDFENNP